MHLIAVLALFVAVAQVQSHGYLKDPVARTSIQTRPEFNTQQPYWWDNQGVWCGNVQQNLQYSSCGRCGDVQGETTANQGGIYDKGVITGTYSAGSIINVVANFQAPHHGYFEVELCPNQQESDNCFTKLPIVGGSEDVRDGNRICVPYDNVNTDITARVQLPAGVTCSRCTLRWTYRTSYPGPAGWDSCYNAQPAQTFRNCADITIN